MEIGAREIHHWQFHDAWRGYSQEEVDDFLDKLADVVDRLQRENRALVERVRDLEQNVSTGRDAEDLLTKTLVSAQQAAEQAIAKAKVKAEQLIAQAEESAKKAAEEARQKAAAIDTDLRRKTVDAESTYVERKKSLEIDIERLRAFETEIKHRLKGFLEQQLKALESVPDRPPARAQQARPAAQGPAPAAQAPRVETQAPRPRAQAANPEAQRQPRAGAAVPGEVRPGNGPHAGAPGRVNGTERGSEPDADAAPATRRGVRGLFTRQDS